MQREECRAIVRAARRLESAYQARQQELEHRMTASVLPPLEHAFAEVGRIGRLRAHAQQMGWRTAAHRLEARLCRALDHLARLADGLASQFKAPRPTAPPLRELYAELIAAGEEFGAVEIDRHGERISVTTESIWLEEICFGPFRIDLVLPQIEVSEPEYWYGLEALDPNPAAPDSEVVHPHVSGGVLCAGEAGAAIRQTLLAGRLSEFFTLVRSVLRTYNPGSPYVRLREWDGLTCADCGYTAAADCGFTCPGCADFVCDECARSCDACGETRCRSCLTLSQISSDWACPDCEAECEGCSRTCVKNELDDNGLCEECQKENDHEESDVPEAADDDGVQAPGQTTAGAERADLLGQRLAEAPVPLPSR